MEINVIQTILISLITAFCFRVRGGFGEKWGWKLPLCKWWFCTAWTLCCCYLMKDYNWHSWLYWQKVISIFIGARLGTAFCGWGEAVSLAIGARKKPDPKEMNELDFDEFCDKFGWNEHDFKFNIKVWKWTLPIHLHIKGFKLIDHPKTYGVVWLTLRGILLSYLIASPMNNLLLMLWGAPMGIIYWFAGWLYRKGLNDGKSGWRIAEWLYGFWLGLGLAILTKKIICVMV